MTFFQLPWLEPLLCQTPQQLHKVVKKVSECVSTEFVELTWVGGNQKVTNAYEKGNMPIGEGKLRKADGMPLLVPPAQVRVRVVTREPKISSLPTQTLSSRPSSVPSMLPLPSSNTLLPNEMYR